MGFSSFSNDIWAAHKAFNKEQSNSLPTPKLSLERLKRLF
jgi:hypothetical protein